MAEKTSEPVDPVQPTAPAHLPRSPSGRVPQWVIDERLGVRSPDDARRSAPPPPAQPPNRRARLLVRTGWVLGALAVLGIALTLQRFQDERAGGPVPPAAAEQQRPVDVPPLSREVAAAPIGTAPRPAVRSASFRYIATRPGSGEPVTWDPCRPIHYVVRPAHAPAGGAELIGTAIREVSRVTGLQFVDDGTTNEAPGPDREPYQPGRYGERWAPVVIAWETAAENPDFEADVAGEAGPQPVSWAPHPPVHVTGSVSLDAKKFATLLADPSEVRTARAIVLHELAHLVGLDHVQDRKQIMYPESNPEVTTFGAGDLAGLWSLGRGPCAPWL